MLRAAPIPIHTGQTHTTAQRIYKKAENKSSLLPAQNFGRKSAEDETPKWDPWPDGTFQVDLLVALKFHHYTLHAQMTCKHTTAPCTHKYICPCTCHAKKTGAGDRETET